MEILPAFDEFSHAWNGGHNQLLRLEASADLETPVSLLLKLASGHPQSFLLESVTGGEIRGRYSVIGTDPDLIWRCKGERAEISLGGTGAFRPDPCKPLDSLRNLLDECSMKLASGIPPMAAGLFGYLGYDIIRQIERLPLANPDPLDLPDAMLIRPRLVAVVDNIKGQVMLGVPVWNRADADPHAAYGEAANRLTTAFADLDKPATSSRGYPTGTVEPTEPVSNTSREEYGQMVLRAKDYIRAGDIFQVVPSQRWALPFPLPPLSLYRALRRTNPSPYMFFFDFDDFQVIGASPEILVRCRDQRVTIRPIAGTRPRGASMEEDRVLEEELLADPKERAEHLMLLDLGRNDIGRVAELGTVTPTEQFTVERYSHVMHIVSNIEGTLRSELSALDALLAALPAGTVSGAPKIRAMEIIDELERVKRGVYAGAIGYFSANGDMDTCIALRTAVLKDQVMHMQAGGGVVYDSDPEREYEETIAKAGALLRAAREAPEFALERTT